MESMEGYQLKVKRNGILFIWIADNFRILTIPIHNATTLYPMNSSLICASHTVYTIDPDSGEQDPPIPASNHPVHTILTSSPGSTRASSFLTAAESDHFIGVFSVDTRKLIGNLVVENEVTSLTFYTGDEIRRDSEANIDVLDSMMRPRQALAAVNRDGLLELFPAPFEFITSNTQKDSTKPGSRPKRMTRKATALIKITRPDQAGTVVPLINASFQGNEIVMAWTEGGVKLMFERIQWRDEKTGNFLVSGTKEIIRGKDGPGVGAVVMNGVKDMGLSHVDESHTVVANGEEVDDEVQMAVAPPEVIDISSGEEESEFGDFDVDRAPEQTSELSKPEDTDIDMADAEAKAVGDDEEEEPGEPSFGDLIRANAPETVDVAATFAEPNVQALTSSGERSLQLPSGVSLSTVLAQSLRTNDATLLETCFTVSDLSMVRTTIERLDSSLATVLLQRLAERLHNRPGRAGSLMVWIQWTLVAHGGYLAGQPAVMKKLASLHRVVKERANSLQSLLSLKGKLDMLEAQMNLRKSMQGRSQNAINGDDDDEDDVIYVEGQEESSSEDESPINTTTSKPTSKHPKPTSLSETIPNNSDTDESSADSASDGMPTTTATNGILTSSSASSNEEEEDLFDDEAEETDDDSGDAEGADEMDDEDDESADSELEVPVPKRMARVGLSNGVGSSSSSSAFKRR